VEEAQAVARGCVKQQLTDALGHMTCRRDDGGDNVLIIDGKALLHALADDMKATLLQVVPPSGLTSDEPPL
jgi:hypothetical protein